VNCNCLPSRKNNRITITRDVPRETNKITFPQFSSNFLALLPTSLNSMNYPGFLKTQQRNKLEEMQQITSPWWYAECSATDPANCATFISFVKFRFRHVNTTLRWPGLKPGTTYFNKNNMWCTFQICKNYKRKKNTSKQNDSCHKSTSIYE